MTSKISGIGGDGRLKIKEVARRQEKNYARDAARPWTDEYVSSRTYSGQEPTST